MRVRFTCLAVLGCLPIALVALSCSGTSTEGDDNFAGDDGASKDDWGNGGGDTSIGVGGAGGGQITGTDGTGSCGSDCETTEAGPGTTKPFDPETHDSSNVDVDDDGALVLDKTGVSGPHLIWIANSQGGTVSKVDTTTFVELGRYATGSGDPSRTSVDSFGDVYVANRNGKSVTKISALAEKCPDTNGDGVITTSNGPQNVLPYGQDDCRLWETPLGHALRGVAAQDIYTQVPPSDPDLPPTIKEEHYVWVGTLDKMVWKLDGKTGQVLATTQSPCPVYGLALDGGGQLWMTSGSCVGRIDTTKCVDDASCNALEVCSTSCDASGACADTCDAAGKQAISFPDNTYGITVDFKQRVWLAGGSGLKRYDPKAPAAQRYAASQNGFSHGVAADGNGFVWGARHPQIVRLNGDTMEHVILETPSSKGMAVDKDGKIWAISYQNSFATVVQPGPGLNDNTIINNAVTGLQGPYTYSDMTGLQAALAKNDPGHYVEHFEGCKDGDTTWMDLVWEAIVPAKTGVTFRVRTASNPDALAAAKWIVAAAVPPATSPVSLKSKLQAAGIAPGRFLDLDVWLAAEIDAEALVTPKVKSFGVTYKCPPKVN